MDGSVAKLSAGYSFFIPSLYIKYSNNVPLFASFFTTECLAILVALHTIKTLNTCYFVIVSDSQSCLMALNTSPLASPVFYLILQIRSILLSRSSLGYTINLLWVPSHTRILGKEIADALAISCYTIASPLQSKFPAPILHPISRHTL
uniref:RNase H type-1 domain-containing protein n=1 Tax=Sipha flava TaxID=143950 RepID=A0A2S2QK82_9HEMI